MSSDADVIPSRFIEHAGIRLHVKDSGSGEPVVMLHGFPEAWYSWRNQIAPLTQAGYRVIAPDLRGYNLSDRPLEVAAYAMERLVEDAVAVIRDAGAPVTLVGHDWGGMISWFVAMRHPELLRRLIILNAPHPIGYMRALRTTIEQKLRASYQLYLAMPFVPEMTLPFVLPAAMRRAARFSPEDLAVYRAMWKTPGACHAMANYYRALRLGMPKIGTSVRTVSVPTMLIWGDQEKAFSRKTIEPIREWVPAIRIEHIADAGHFVQTDAPARVTELMLGFLGEPAGAP